MSKLEDRGLPANLYAERLVLGSVLLDGSHFPLVANMIGPDDFILEKHRRIFKQMTRLHSRGETIDRVTVAHELLRHNELESDGLSYLASLDEGLPRICNLQSYVYIVKDMAVRRRTITLLDGLQKQLLLDGHDTGEVLTAAEQGLRELAQENRLRENMRAACDVIRAEGGMETFFQPPAAGVPTPWPTLNKLTFGLQRGDLVLLGGRPSTGKTSVALAITLHAATHSIRTAVFSLEVSDKTLLQKLSCLAAGVRWLDFRSDTISAAERNRIGEALELLSDKVWLSQHPTCTASTVRDEVQRLKKHEIGLVVVDYLQLMEAPTHQNRYLEVGAISRELKLAAHELDLPFLVLSQLSRASESEKRRPTMRDLRESGNLEQDADVVLMLCRNEDEQCTELGIVKQRHGEAGRWIKMRFDMGLGRLLELARGDESNELQSRFR